VPPGGFPPGGTFVNPRLDLDTAHKPYVLLDVECPTTKAATLAFITDKGYAEVPVPVWNMYRTSIVEVGYHPLWRGKLKLLALSFPDESSHQARIERIRLSDRPGGKPFLYVRSLAPGRAILRAGREEEIVAVVRSLGGPARNVAARLCTAKGIWALHRKGPRALGDIDHAATEMVKWRVRSDHPLHGKVHVVLTADGFGPSRKSMDVTFRPALNLPKATYVPRPQPAKTDYTVLMHYCPLWKFGTH